MLKIDKLQHDACLCIFGMLYQINMDSRIYKHASFKDSTSFTQTPFTTAVALPW